MNSEYKLEDYQEYMIEKCFEKKKACMYMHMGLGKTLTACELVLKILEFYKNQKLSENHTNIAVIVSSKTLVPTTWKHEINKFYKVSEQDSLNTSIKYEILLKIDDKYKPQKDTQIIITTPEVLLKCYKEKNIDQYFISKQQVSVNKFLNTEKVFYSRPTEPFINKEHPTGLEFFYSRKFSCLVVDEVQEYTNILTIKNQAMSSICADYRYLLS